jgi:hypothetical protein
MNSSLGFLTPVEEEASALFPQLGLLKDQMATREGGSE